MPTTPADHLKIGHVLRFYGQTIITQADINRVWTAQNLATLTVTASDADLLWSQASCTLTVKKYDQYGARYNKDATIQSSILYGNGTLTPASRSGTSYSQSFTYVRDQEITDISPTLFFQASTGQSCSIHIVVRDDLGIEMY
jgi:hypothetical protein